jgi:predicted Rossmann fold flavoprotein
MRYYPGVEWDAIVVGAGAAGLMCAIEAGKRGRRVAVLEHNAEPGRKILISGGGRCNFTNLHTRPENFLSANPHFAKSALSRYSPADFVSLVRSYSICYHEKKDGQLFCDHSAREIVGMLLRECERADVRVFLSCHVEGVRHDTRFAVSTSAGEFAAPALVIATGGLSIPKIGATDFGYRIAQQFGLRIVPCYPALVPLVFSPEDAQMFAGLAGVATDARVFNQRAGFSERMLFTHRGLSGPAILQISSYWRHGEGLSIDFLPGVGDLLERKRTSPKMSLRAALEHHLPRRLAENLAGARNASLLGSMPDRELEQLETKVHGWRLRPAGTEGYQKAEVTGGGIDTNEISSRTMESRNIRGLYFVGEVVDVTGHLGGFNFQWAWASGFAAGQSI